jgi:hypothetical protein
MEDIQKGQITDMEKLTNELENWQHLARMPIEKEGFFLTIDKEQDGSLRQKKFFTYKNTKTHRAFSVLYDKATKEYLGKVSVGLREFCDIGYMAADIGKLEELLDRRLDDTLHALGKFSKEYLGGEFLQKKILDWSYAEELPCEVSGFELFISPREPVKVLNGSYIIIDYSDFIMESSLIIYYNIFRDEFFGELMFKHTPMTTAEFDAKTLPELEDKIKSGLKTVLESLRSKLNAL